MRQNAPCHAKFAQQKHCSCARKQKPQRDFPHSRRTTFRTWSGFTAARARKRAGMLRAAVTVQANLRCHSACGAEQVLRATPPGSSHESFLPKTCPYLIDGLSFISKLFMWRLHFAAERIWEASDHRRPVFNPNTSAPSSSAAGVTTLDAEVFTIRFPLLVRTVSLFGEQIKLRSECLWLSFFRAPLDELTL